MVIDSHAHLTDDLFLEIDEILVRAQNARVSKIINICLNPLSLERGFEIQKNHPYIYNAAAVHPQEAGKQEGYFNIIKEQGYQKKLIAIGETGLDYYYQPVDRNQQKKTFVEHLHLALELQLPVIIHCREAFKDFFEIIDQEYPSHRGVLHCFTGTLEDAKNLVRRGWKISLSGIVTYKKSDLLKQVAEWLPMEYLMLETDAPFLAPQAYRGKQNEPSFIIETAKAIAALKNVSLEYLVEVTTLNTINFFNL